jgi:hypothetical protein
MATNNIIGTPSPPMSLGLQLGVMKGRNQIQRNIGTFSALYEATGSRIAADYVELGPGQIYQSNANEQITRLVVSTSGSLAFVGFKGTAEIDLTVSQMLVLDDTLTSFSLANNGTVLIRLEVDYVAVPT